MAFPMFVTIPEIWQEFYKWIHSPFCNLNDEFTRFAVLNTAKYICCIEDKIVAERLWYERSLYSPLFASIMTTIRPESIYPKIEPKFYGHPALIPNELQRTNYLEFENFYKWARSLDLSNDEIWMIVVYEAQKIGILPETIPEPLENLIVKNCSYFAKDDKLYLLITKDFRGYSGGIIKKFQKNEIYSVFKNSNGVFYPDTLL